MNRVRKLIEAEYAYERGYTGKNCVIVILDTGIAGHDDLKQKVLCFQDFVHQQTQPYDDNGHGTHIAGIIAGSGFHSGGLYHGVAPDCGIIVLKVMDANGNGKTSHFLRAIDWILENKERYGIRIANISAGMYYDATDAMQRRLLQAVEYMWNQGILVMTAAGNNGPGKESITVPGILRTVITVGSSDDRMIPNHGRKTGYSGEGPTRQCIVKPELLAPGTNILSCGLKNKEYVRKSGTSMATPVASGSLALLLEKYPFLTPPEVKLRLYQRLKTDFQDACWGTLNVRKLLS